MTLDAKLDPPLPDRHVVMGGVRLTDPLEQHLLDTSMIEQLTVDDLRKMTPPVPSRPSMMGASIAALNRMIAGAFAACKPADADRAS